jgi:hypothetical protein
MSKNETPTTQPKIQEELFKYPIFKTIKELLQDIQNLEVKEELKK